MLRILLILACAAALAACSGANSGVSTLQFSGAAEPFPSDYQARVLRYLGEQPATGATVSYPQTTVGETAFSPKRWYVCLHGLAPSGPPPTRLKPVLELAHDLVASRPVSGVYEVVLVLRASGTVSAIKGFDSPLCASGRYEALPAV